MHTLESLRSGQLAGIRQLDLSCGLTAVPDEVRSLAPSLEVLNLTGNQLNTLPAWLAELGQLKVLFCSNNLFEHLPEVLGACPSLEIIGLRANRLRHVPADSLPNTLRSLVLTDNLLAELPATLGLQPHLQKLMLTGNRLRSLPESLQQAERLELLRIAANELSDLPDWLTDLPALSWLAMAGNPWPWRGSTPRPAVRQMRWSELTIKEQLGQGASGVVHRVSGSGHLSSPDLALKLFKGCMTSDGRPDDEVTANLLAGRHPQLCSAMALLSEHPEGTPGLLLPLLPPNLVRLAGPPSLSSCTRDLYANSLQLNPSVTLRVARDVAQALAHLHGRRLLHGDLYAHNILWDPSSGEAILSDLGAACPMPTRSDERQLQKLFALDTRAFGVLLDELMQRTQPSSGATAHDPLDKCRQVTQACLNPQASQRPTLVDVAHALGTPATD
jgi:hypothetical protein